MIDSSAMPPRHAGEGRYLRLLFVAATKAVDTGLRRHDDVCGAGGSILRIPGIRLVTCRNAPSLVTSTAPAFRVWAAISRSSGASGFPSSSRLARTDP